jgi:hypothetical protein
MHLIARLDRGLRDVELVTLTQAGGFAPAL